MDEDKIVRLMFGASRPRGVHTLTAKFVRDQFNNRCGVCWSEDNKHKNKLAVHHIVPWFEALLKFFPSPDHLDNLIPLCPKCHILAHQEVEGLRRPDLRRHQSTMPWSELRDGERFPGYSGCGDVKTKTWIEQAAEDIRKKPSLHQKTESNLVSITNQSTTNVSLNEIGRAYYELGKLSSEQGNTDKAHFYYSKSAKIANDTGQKLQHMISRYASEQSEHYDTHRSNNTFKHDSIISHMLSGFESKSAQQKTRIALEAFETHYSDDKDVTAGRWLIWTIFDSVKNSLANRENNEALELLKKAEHIIDRIGSKKQRPYYYEVLSLYYYCNGEMLKSALASSVAIQKYRNEHTYEGNLFPVSAFIEVAQQQSKIIPAFKEIHTDKIVRKAFRIPVHSALRNELYLNYIQKVLPHAL